MRPPSKASHPERTDEKYCTYYPRHRDYGLQADVLEKLVRECSTAEGFTKLTGKPARDKTTGQLVGAAPLQGIPRVPKPEPAPPARQQESA